MKKLFFLLLIVTALTGFAFAQGAVDGDSTMQDSAPAVVMSGNYTDICIVTPDTVSTEDNLSAERCFAKFDRYENYLCWFGIGNSGQMSRLDFLLSVKGGDTLRGS